MRISRSLVAITNDDINDPKTHHNSYYYRTVVFIIITVDKITLRFPADTIYFRGYRAAIIREFQYDYYDRRPVATYSFGLDVYINYYYYYFLIVYYICHAPTIGTDTIGSPLTRTADRKF